MKKREKILGSRLITDTATINGQEMTPQEVINAINALHRIVENYLCSPECMKETKDKISELVSLINVDKS